MKHIQKASIAFLSAWAAIGAHAAAPEVVPGEFIVKMRPRSGFSVQSVGVSLFSAGYRIKSVVSDGQEIYLVKPDAGLNVNALRTEESQKVLASMEGVEYVEPNYVYRASMGSKPPKPTPKPTPTPSPKPEPPTPPASGEVIPSDPDFGSLWGLRNIGQKDSSRRTGKAGADIKAANAWGIAHGSKKVIVAVVDTGIDYNHPDLKANIWSMPGNPSVHGFNAINGKLDPMDDHYHGTHCAGTIGGTGNNGLGVAGVNWDVTLMGVKFLDSQGSGSTEGAIKAIDFARAHGAMVMSNSWGGGGFSKALQEAIQRAADAGIVFIAAAGNDSSDNDDYPSYPANYPLENVISVAASNNVDEMSGFSNYGANSVDLMAPGENILSTATGAKYKTLSGTSMATPHVSGAAALLLSVEPNLTPAQVKARINNSTDKVAAAKGKTKTGGRLNVYNMLKAGAHSEAN